MYFVLTALLLKTSEIAFLLHSYRSIILMQIFVLITISAIKSEERFIEFCYQILLNK